MGGRLLWHYTVGAHFQKILRDGVLRPAAELQVAGGSEVRRANERPAVWFSSREWWEPTASTDWTEGGSRRTLDMAETFARAGGLLRFGVETSTAPLSFSQFVELCVADGADRGYFAAMEKVGRDRGSNPNHWFAALGSVPREKWARVECFDIGEPAPWGVQEKMKRVRNGRWVHLSNGSVGAAR